MFSQALNKHWRTTLVALALVLGTAACSDSKTAEEYQAEAQGYFAQKDYQASIIALKNAITADTSNYQSRLLLGQVYLKIGDGYSAVKELERASSLSNKPSDVAPILARAYFLTDSFQEIVELEGLELLSPELQVKLLAYKTVASIRLLQLEQAKVFTEQALSILPSNFFTMLSEAYVSFAKNDVEKALAIVEKAIALTDNEPEAYMLQARILSKLEKFPQASKSLEKYIELQPSASIAYLMLAEAYLNSQQYADAEKYADYILARLPNQPLANFIKASSLFDQKNYAESKRFAEIALQGDNTHLPSRYVAGASSYLLNNYEQANIHLSAIVEYLPADHPVQKIYVISRFQLGLVEDVTDVLEDFSPKSEEDTNFLSALSLSLYSIGAVEQAKTLANKSFAQTPTNSEQQLRTGTLKLMLNDSSGVTELEKALSGDPELLSAKLLLAYDALNKKEFDKALSIAQQLQNNSESKVEGYNLAGAIYLKQEQFSLAEQSFKNSLSIQEDNLYALTELAKNSYQNQQNEVAQQYIARAVQSHPNNVKALRYYFIISGDASLDAIEKAYESKSEGGVDLAILYSQILINKKKYSDAIEVLDRLDYSIKSPKAAWQNKVIAYRQMNNVEQYLKLLQQWRDTNPYHVEPAILLVDYQRRKGDFDKALSQVNSALQGDFRDNTMLKLAKMELLLDSANVVEAKILYEELKRLDLNTVLYTGMSGRIKFIEKKYKEAAIDLQQFYNANPSSENAIFLSIALNQSSQQGKALKVLTDYLTKDNDNVKVRVLLANFYLASDHLAAIKQYDILLTKQPDNVLFLNNVAWLKMEAGRLTEAEKHSKRAFELKPNIPNVVDTYSQILLKLGRNDEALDKSSTAIELSDKKDMDIMINYVEALIANQLLEQAQDTVNDITPITEQQRAKLATLKQSL